MTGVSVTTLLAHPFYTEERYPAKKATVFKVDNRWVLVPPHGNYPLVIRPTWDQAMQEANND